MPYKCHHCEQCFKIKPPWLKHMKEAHDKKPFICDEVDCNFSFRSLDLLKRHKKKHLESRLGKAQRTFIWHGAYRIHGLVFLAKISSWSKNC